MLEARLRARRAADGDGNQIAAPSLAKLTVGGDKRRRVVGSFQADLLLNGTGQPKLTLGSVRIAGSATGAWLSKGNAGPITIAGNPADWTLQGIESSGEGLGNVMNITVGDADNCQVPPVSSEDTSFRPNRRCVAFDTPRLAAGHPFPDDVVEPYRLSGVRV